MSTEQIIIWVKVLRKQFKDAKLNGKGKAVLPMMTVRELKDLLQSERKLPVIS